MSLSNVRPLVAMWCLIIAAGTPARAATAELREVQLANGVRIEYLVAAPQAVSDGRAVPALLVLPGGKQTIESARANLARYWLDEALRLGYLVICPAAPAGRPFYEDGADLIPEFLQRQLALFQIADGKFDVAGFSNGAVSAFIAASRSPQLFRSVTALAGYPVNPFDFDNLDRLQGIAVTMFVGEHDLPWKEGMERVRDRLQTLGIPVYLEEVPRNGHLLPALSFEYSARIFRRMPR